MPCVSVVIIAFNAGTLIGETLDSILAQTFRDFEVIVVDNGSTDNTREVVSRYPAPVRLISGKRLTKSAGRNVGIRSARGEYIALVDADDLWLPEKLAMQIERLESLPTVRWVYSDCYTFDGRTGQTISTWSSRTRLCEGNILQPLLRDCIVASPTPVIHRTIFDEVGFFDESFLRHEPEDWDMWLRIAERYPVGLVNQPLARLRIHPGSLTAREDMWLTAEGVIAVVRRTLARNPEIPKGLQNRILADRYVSMGRGLAGAGRASEARALFSCAVKYHPWKVSAYLLWCSTWLGAAVLRRLRTINRARRGALIAISNRLAHRLQSTRNE